MRWVRLQTSRVSRGGGTRVSHSSPKEASCLSDEQDEMGATANK
jgi:hypothetical protein